MKFLFLFIFLFLFSCSIGNRSKLKLHKEADNNNSIDLLPELSNNILINQDYNYETPILFFSLIIILVLLIGFSQYFIKAIKKSFYYIKNKCISIYVSIYNKIFKKI